MEQNHASVLLAACEKRREERRSFLRAAGGIAAIGAGSSLLAACKEETTPGQSTPTPTPSTSAPSEADVLNFALNLEYLEAQFYSFAAFGVGLDANLLTGTGTQGTVTGGQRVTFTDPLVAAYAREIARDEIAHVTFLRTALGASARIAMPSIDIGSSASGAFSSAARAAGLITGTTSTFDPYFSDENFLLAAYLFEDVGPTAYKGGIRFLTTASVVEAAAGIHAAESYHAGLIRTVLYRKGLTTASLITSADRISDARDSLDGSTDLDQGISSSGSGASIKSNIVPTDTSGITFTRTPQQVLNVVYLNSRSVDRGGFFPNGVNGNLRASAANA
ncbi:ferritin-like domain-containing protein [Sphingomonas floccifaciens]|uniref:Ferritin-like domain-containing protein n=1 Tax=Sphingomonas floccifaciens TaxID=1844115 RepID=A0ABW4NDW4_9SPHN